MARPQLDDAGAPGANGRRAGHSSRGGRAAGASAGGAALDGGLPAPPGAGSAGADARLSGGWERRRCGS